MTFESAGVAYFVNGFAKQYADRYDWTDIKAIWGPTYGMGALIDMGLQLC
ncbi:MAG: hypothetical protein LC792_18425 [Actinobacteria bacterium]|nr:hypothetical protein [Actinomycetota bacterium]